MTVLLSLLPSGALLAAGATLGARPGSVVLACGRWDRRGRRLPAETWRGLARAVGRRLRRAPPACRDPRPRPVHHRHRRRRRPRAASPDQRVDPIGVALAILISVGLWSAYSGKLADLAEHALARTHGAGRARIARDGYTTCILVIISGIVYAALGVEEAMAQIPSASRSVSSEPRPRRRRRVLTSRKPPLRTRHAASAAAFVRFGGAHRLALAAISRLALVPPMAALAIVVLVLFTLPVAERRLADAVTAEQHRRG